MLDGIGGGLWPQVQSLKFPSTLLRASKVLSLVIGILFLSLFAAKPAFAGSTIDFSSFKNYFRDINIGEKTGGNLSNGTIPNPYTSKGYVVGYKLAIPKEVDPGKVDLSVKSCTFQFLFICVGSSFTEKIYVYDSSFKPLSEGADFKNSLSFSKIKVPNDRIIYLLVGSDAATETGEFVISADMK